MALGSVQTLVVCVPVQQATGPEQQAVCPAVDGKFFAPANMQAYVIEASNAATFEAQNGEFDYVKAGEIYSFGFCSVLLLWASTKGIAAVLNMVKS
jgi:hypothetical protein